MRTTLAKLSDDQRIALEFFDKTLPVYSCLSIKSPQPDDDVPLRCFQILSKATKLVAIETYRNVQDDEVFWLVQPFDILWGDKLPATPKELNAFMSCESLRMDILQFLGDPIENRGEVKLWNTSESDIESCALWREPRDVEYKGSLMQSTTPVLALLDKLRAEHFTAVYKAFTHHKRSGKYFDARDLPSKRCYLQCCLVSSSLYEKGVQTFVSGKSEAFYKLLLSNPLKATGDLTAQACRLLLKNVDASSIPRLEPSTSVARGVDVDSGDDHADVSVGKFIRGRPKKAVAKKKALAAMGVDVDSGSGNVSNGSRTGASSSSSSSSRTPTFDTSASNKCSVDADSGSDSSNSDDDDYPRRVEGAKIRRETHKSKKSKGLRVSCTRHGASCRRFRALDKWVETFGPQAPVLYLGAWLAKLSDGDVSEKEHKAYNPSVTQVRAYIEKTCHRKRIGSILNNSII